MIQKYKIITLIQAFLICLLFAGQIYAQEEESATKGTEFWVAFLPNFHNSVIDENLEDTDSLYILIAAEEVTSGKIEYRNFFGQEFEYDFTITNPEKVYSFRLLWDNFELRGLNTSDGLITNSQNEKIAKQSFKITTDKGVNVYAHSQAVTTSEAATIYPVNALDNEYYIMSYNSDGDKDWWTDQLYSSSTPSQYAIVAPYDDTRISINNSTRTWNNNNTTQNITLNSGDVYLVQADMNTNIRADLTGSRIESDKPIAVFTGHQRAKVPAGNGASRDMLYEQIPSVKSLGREYFVTPFYQPNSINSEGNDKYRVMALSDNTTITFSNGTNDANLDAGEFIERNLFDAHKITANKKIMVAVYKKTSQSGQVSADSDPFLMILPPAEKFSNSYRFLNLQVEDPEIKGQDVYAYQYITLITDNRNLSNRVLEIDGVNISDLNFEDIDGTGYSYRNIEVGDGNHTIEGIYNFTVLVYGYGYANSYAYFAGMNYKGDQINPKFQSANDCFMVSGIVTDSTYLDSGIDIMEVISEESYNTETIFDDFESPADVTSFSSRLVNKYEDGVVKIKATDASGLSTSATYDITGFTVAFEGLNDYSDGEEQLVFIDSTAHKNQHCIELTLYNYGKFDQNVDEITLSNANFFFVNTQLPVTIKPDERQIIEICFSGGDYDIYETDVIIADKCTDREAAQITLLVAGDDTPPEINSIPDECFEEIEISITDTTVFDIGIAEVNVMETENCEIRIRNEAHDIYELTAYILDTRQDAYFRIEVADSNGNRNEYEEFIQGFTLNFITSFGDENTGNLSIDYGEQVVGDVICDTVSITNYGSMPFEIDKPWFYEHIYFSTPESNFPITLEPGETGQFPVCFRSISVREDDYIDTLYFNHNCDIVKIPLNAISDTLFVNAGGRCEVPLQMTITETPKDYYVLQNYPNPFQETTIITVGVPETGRVQLDIYNSLGTKVKSIADIELSPGIYRFEISKEDMPQGLYYYDVKIDNFRKVRKMLVQ
jgi:hypothetical protein